MENLLKYMLPIDPVKRFPDRNSKRQFELWDQPARYAQIALITFLSATLYLVFNLLNKPWISEDFNSVVFQLHGFINVPILMLTSLMAYKKVNNKILMPCLALAPIIAMAIHIFISSKLEDNSYFLAEGYFVVLWVFIVSGLTLSYAIVTSLIIAIMLITSGFYILSKPAFYSMYVFWICCSFSFGLLSALILYHARKSVYFTQMELQKLAITDPLTGVFNRSVFNQVMTDELAKEGLTDSPFGLLVIDVDHFKRINDTMGHKVGDQVIIQIAETLAEITQPNSTLVRWGGEEFVVIVPKINSKSLTQLCDLITTSIENESFISDNTITVSIGATLYRAGDSQDSLLVRADNAMYQAKEEGRNRFVINK